jgi:hypothetical protein
MPLDSTNYEILKEETLRVLREGRERIAQPWGWCKGTFYKIRSNRLESYCALGGVMAFDSSWGMQIVSKSDSAILALFSALPEKYKDIPAIPTSCIGRYNDAKERRKVHILALYDRAMTLVEKDAVYFEDYKCLENEDL